MTGIGASGDRRNSVNRRLTPKRPVANDEYAAFARRILRGYSRRIAAGDIDALADMMALSADVDQAIHDAVRGLREFGYSWADIGKRAGMTRQAAQQRWGSF